MKIVFLFLVFINTYSKNATFKEFIFSDIVFTSSSFAFLTSMLIFHFYVPFDLKYRCHHIIILKYFFSPFLFLTSTMLSLYKYLYTFWHYVFFLFASVSLTHLLSRFSLAFFSFHSRFNDGMKAVMIYRDRDFFFAISLVIKMDIRTSISILTTTYNIVN